MKLAERLKALRLENHLKQEEVAKELGISMRTYCRYEYGEREPAASALWRMADFYGVSIDYMVGRRDER